jgi:hypothetical protein
VVVVLLDGELDLSTGVSVTKTENRAINVSRLELLDQFLTMLAETT